MSSPRRNPRSPSIARTSNCNSSPALPPSMKKPRKTVHRKRPRQPAPHGRIARQFGQERADVRVQITGMQGIAVERPDPGPRPDFATGGGNARFALAPAAGRLDAEQAGDLVGVEGIAYDAQRDGRAGGCGHRSIMAMSA